MQCDAGSGSGYFEKMAGKNPVKEVFFTLFVMQ